jgi:hypothetical protein
MMLSVFRQGGRTQQLDHLAVIDLAVDDEAAQMVLFSRLRGKPTLVGLSDGQAIIKPLETGDDTLSFEGLFDTCVSIREYRRLIQHRKSDPADLPPFIYEIDIVADVGFSPTVRLRLKAKDDQDVKARLEALFNLLNEDSEGFREAITDEIAAQLFRSDQLRLTTPGAFRTDEASGDEPDWELVPQKPG